MEESVITKSVRRVLEHAFQPFGHWLYNMDQMLSICTQYV